VRRRSFIPTDVGTNEPTEVTELCLGTWGLCSEGYASTGFSADGGADAVIDRALQLGIGLFDTSDAYEKGGMLERLGRHLAFAKSASVVVRVGVNRSQDARKDFEPAYVREAVQRAGERLKRSRVDVVLLHNPTVSTVDRAEATGVLEEMRMAGMLGAWGVSAGNREVAKAAMDAGAKVVSLVYNVFHPFDLNAIAADVAMRGVAVLAHSVLAYGLLAAHWGPNHRFDEGDHRNCRWSASTLRLRIEQLSVVRDLVGGDVLTARAAALRFVLSNRLVSSVVLGPRNPSQLDQLVREAGHGPPYLSDKAISELPSKLQAVGIHA